jgi:hypothetical protein
MKIKYIHSSNPNKEKIYDTEKALKNNSFYHMTQKEFDEMELENMERDKKDGYIISYEVLQEEK